jgi:acyl-coenzyme A synthetase/AMP-(fatty) acid ligase
LSIRNRLDSTPDFGRWLWGVKAGVCLDAVREGTCLVDAGRLAGRSVLIATDDPFAAALALIELDGVASRLIIGTPDLSREQLQAIVNRCGMDAVVSDRMADPGDVMGWRVACRFDAVRPRSVRVERHMTEWVLLTSGTTGLPKMVVHTLETLTAPISSAHSEPADVVWGTFYDIRRYGGLQILLRALFGRGSMVVSGAGEAPGDYLARLAHRRATHVSGTATHWRRALMSPMASAISPRYIRLSGEIADQGILNALRSFYPGAKVGHAFASTEAGVAFEVDDGLEGFPAGLVSSDGDVCTTVVDGSLRIRSSRAALRYLDASNAVADADGFVDTGDMVERRGDRFYFLGRRTGVINVGGLKVYPEEVEAAINRHPAVRMSLVHSRKNAITGALVAADVVLNREPPPAENHHGQALKQEILQLCRDQLAPHKIPATLRFVPALDVADAGKLARRDA